MRIIKKVDIKNVPDGMIFHIIESISENMMDDAKRNFGDTPGFKKALVIYPKKGYIECFIKFPPYKYDFIWNVEKKSAFEHVVSLDARTSGGFSDYLFGMREKLGSLADTQWSAFLNFCVGFVSGVTYEDFVSRKVGKGVGGKAHRTHIKKAWSKVREGYK